MTQTPVRRACSKGRSGSIGVRSKNLNKVLKLQRRSADTLLWVSVCRQSDAKPTLRTPSRNNAFAPRGAMTDRVIDRPRPSVLVVEDEPSLRQVIVDGLEADGFAVAQALDGADAVARLHGFAYDALVIDLRLPDANGMDVLEEALTLFPTIRAVVITGFGTVNEAGTAITRA